MDRQAPPSLPTPGDHVERYEVLADVARGGMAALFAVRRSGVGGFDKVLGMKILLPHMSEERPVVDMFLDEGRIAACIDHPNVVPVFDLGEHAGLPYLVMEYVRGQSLARIIRAARRTRTPVSSGFCAAVLARAAAGLHGAHEARDRDGAPLNVVHRDVSPQNIMVSYAGDVKVLDFGIALARGRIASTRTGELKGKISYMAPEALSKNAPVDRRADVWALGVIAWELFAGRRLFREDEDAATMYNVMEKRVPALDQLRPDLPPALPRCVMACLERDPEKRTEDCDIIARVFEAAALQLGRGSRDQIAAAMESWFSEEKAVEADRLGRAARLLKEDTEPSLDSLSARNLAPPEDTRLTSSSVVAAPPNRSWWLAGALVSTVIGGMFAYEMMRGAPDAASPDAASPVASGEAAAPAVTVTLPVAANVKLVLVEGVRHNERPVVVEIEPTGSVEIDLVGVDGGSKTVTITAQDDGAPLALPHAGAEPLPMATTTASAVTAPAPSPTRPLPHRPPAPAPPAPPKTKPSGRFNNPYR